MRNERKNDELISKMKETGNFSFFKFAFVASFFLLSSFFVVVGCFRGKN